MSLEQIQKLAGELGLSDKQIAAMRKKYGSDAKLLKRLRQWHREAHVNTLGKVHLLGKSGGYTERPGYAMRSRDQERKSEPEAIDPAWVKEHVTKAARERERAAGEELILAALEVRQVLRERVSSRQDFRAIAGLNIRRLDKELERLISQTKRKAA